MGLSISQRIFNLKQRLQNLKKKATKSLSSRRGSACSAGFRRESHINNRLEIRLKKRLDQCLDDLKRIASFPCYNVGKVTVIDSFLSFPPSPNSNSALSSEHYSMGSSLYASASASSNSSLYCSPSGSQHSSVGSSSSYDLDPGCSVETETETSGYFSGDQTSSADSSTESSASSSGSYFPSWFNAEAYVSDSNPWYLIGGLRPGPQYLLDTTVHYGRPINIDIIIDIDNAPHSP